MSKSARLAACGALALMGACAPQFHFRQGPGACSPMQWSARHRTGVMETIQKVQRVQARYSLTARYAALGPERWKGAASGECSY